ncbi:hypothetical protein ACJX0J_015715, partial [Zea mays]
FFFFTLSAISLYPPFQAYIKKRKHTFQKHTFLNYKTFKGNLCMSTFKIVEILWSILKKINNTFSEIWDTCHSIEGHINTTQKMIPHLQTK